jgi:DNA repair photolyase
MDIIKRKSLLYKTGVEYGDYTINHVQGCSHGCKYPCYAMMMAKRFGKVKTYEEWCTPKLVSNALELLDKEIPKYKHKISSVHLCFTTDPFMYRYNEIIDLSIKIINKLNSSGIKCTALTKGLLPIELINCSKENEYGITLISLNEEFRNVMEPNSAPYLERINALRNLHDAGCKTWVSIEPYPTPNIIDQNFEEILQSVNFVDKIIFGKLNYNKKVSEYKESISFFNKLSLQVIDFCVRNNKQYHIKNGTMEVKNNLSSTALI